jgi:HupE / UreJ protein
MNMKGSTMRRYFVPLVLHAMAWIFGLSAALAHEVRPAVITADLSQLGKLDVTVSANLEALLAGIGPQHSDTNDAPEAKQYNQLRGLSTAELRQRFSSFAPKWLGQISVTVDGTAVPLQVTTIDVPEVKDAALARISVVRLSANIPVDAKIFRWAYPPAFGTNVLRVKRQGSDELETNWLKDGAVSADIPLAAGPPKSRVVAFYEYVGQGFTHILPLGIDHILFVLGLFLLSTQLRPLLVQVTAFTVAHSITLALGLYGILEISPKIVEPLIALSIVFVAVENLLTTKLTPWRPFVVFGFGLLHGLGFAGVLQDLGLPRDQYVLGLFGFNIGVELGQLAVIGLAYLATAYWFSERTWYRQRIVWPASAAIALTGLFWTVERIWFA